MSALEIFALLGGLVMLATWFIAGAAWFAGILIEHTRDCCDLPRAEPWQYVVGGPLIWLLLFLAWRLERRAAEQPETENRA